MYMLSLGNPLVAEINSNANIISWQNKTPAIIYTLMVNEILFQDTQVMIDACIVLFLLVAVIRQ